MRSRSSSLRLKLTTWFVFVFFAIQLTLVTGVVLLRREAIETTVERAATEPVSKMIDSLLNAGVELQGADLGEYLPKGADFAFCVVRDTQGGVLAWYGVEDDEEVFAKIPFRDELLPSVDGVTEVAGTIGSESRKLSEDTAAELVGTREPLHLITVPFQADDGAQYYFQSGMREDSFDVLLGPYGDLVLFGVPIGLIAAMAAAWIIAGRAVAPMRELSRAARDVSPTRISERFELPTRDAEVAHLEDELNAALERIEAGYRAQDQFISNVSHELRTPVAVLLTQAQVARMGERDLDKSYAFIERAEVLLKRLGKLVESFLVLARAELTDSRANDVVPAVDLILGCLQSCKEYADQNGVRVLSGLDEDGADLVLRGDPELLLTMVENLVRNAISHSPDGGAVTLRAERTRDGVAISVRDEGPGIPDEYRERIFERFVRVPSSTERKDGTGLGLAIANGIATLHGGAIEVRNNELRGCTFTVRLPNEVDAKAS